MVLEDGSAAPVNVWDPLPQILVESDTSSSEASASEIYTRMTTDQKGNKRKRDSTSSISSVKKSPPRKKPVVTGIWPCKINGCNKQFAREADLKRHQRTTKLHSMPSFSCPQCDANFTRTDALRRHQKSRHNGVVIEPVEQNIDLDENDHSRSSSATPSAKGKEKASSQNFPVQTHQGEPSHTGPSSYYRSHTAMISPHIPPRLQKIPQGSGSALPPQTAPPWANYSSNWQNGALPPTMGPIGYMPNPMYYPSPHYRPHTNGYPPGSANGVAGAPNYNVNEFQMQHSNSSPSRNPSSQPPNSASVSSGGDSCIDRDMGMATQELTEAEVVAAVQAVLRQAESAEAAKKLKELENRRSRMGHSQGVEACIDDMDSLDRSMAMGGGLHGYGGSTLSRPEPMEHILTEDGEPMLNPAELLTQESLASPPP